MRSIVYSKLHFFVKKAETWAPPAVVIVDHAVNVDAVAHVHRQDHREESRTEKRPRLHSE